MIVQPIRPLGSFFAFCRPYGSMLACLLLATAHPLGAGDKGATIPPLFSVTAPRDFDQPEETFREIMQLIEKNYYSNTIDEKALWWGAIQGMLRQISPEYHSSLATLWLPKQFEMVDDSLHGVRESIGIKSRFNPVDGSLTVTEVMPEGPSASLLKPLDRIVRINGTPLKGMSVPAISALLAGEPGSKVTLKVIRDVAVFDIDITRKKFRLENVVAEMFPRDIGYLAVRSFSVGAAKDSLEELQRFRRDGVTRLMLDLRGNGGGALKEGLKFAELFIPKGRSLMRVVSHGNNISNYLSSRTDTFAFQLAVLVDGQTASAGEIVAAALRDEAAATLVGEHTYGKATMERIFTLNNECRVKFTTGALYSPRGKSWQKKGLTPQIQVAMEPVRLARTRHLMFDVRLLNDPQLRAAFVFLGGPRQPPAADADGKAQKKQDRENE